MKNLHVIFVTILFLSFLARHSAYAQCIEYTAFGQSFCLRTPTGFINMAEPRKYRITNKKNTGQYSVLLEKYHSYNRNANATLFALNVPAPEKVEDNFDEYLINNSNSSLSKEITFPLPKNSEFRQAILSGKKYRRPVTDQNTFPILASETVIGGYVGKDGYVSETVFVAVNKSIFEFYVGANFVNWDVEGATIIAKELSYNIIEMLFTCNQHGLSIRELALREEVLAGLRMKLAALKTNKSAPIYEEPEVYSYPKATHNHTVMGDIKRIYTENKSTIWLIAGIVFLFIIWRVLKLLYRNKTVQESQDTNFKDTVQEEWTFDEDTTEFEAKDGEEPLSMKECYAILDLNDGVDFDTVKNQYRILVQIHHPDRIMATGEAKEWATEKFRKINLAYATLRTQFGK